MGGSAWGQSLQIDFIELKSNRFVVHYSLTDTVPGRSYTVRAYASHDGFTNPLQKITGDAGLDVKTGSSRIIEWTFSEEVGTAFDGKIVVELRARVFVPFIKTESINQYNVFKRGRSYNLTWEGGSSHNVLNFDLYRGNRKIHSFPNVGNSGHHAFKFPSHIKAGRNYRFRISDSKNSDEVVYTREFKIKRSVPLVLKTTAGIGVATSLFLVLNGNTAEEPGIADPGKPSTN